MMSEFDQNKYKQGYNKEHYKRKELVFKKEEWNNIEKVLKDNDTSLKQIILDYVNRKQKKEEKDS